MRTLRTCLFGALAVVLAIAMEALAAKPLDLNGDARSDMLWRNYATGDVYRYLVNGFTLTGGATVYGEPDLDWDIAATADFTGDGVTDLLWRNRVTGQIFLMPFSGAGTPVPGAIIYVEPNMDWRIVHSPDIDGDNRADLLWWNARTGEVYAMLVNGFSLGVGGMVHHEPDTHWRIVATGDFAGSGKQNQLLWRHQITGQVYLMTVTSTGGGFTRTGQMIYTEPDTNWGIVAAADLNGDGRSDVIWRNAATGGVYVMIMNGAAITVGALVYVEPNLAWKIVAQGDYNGDNRADLLWRNDVSGEVYMMHMNGTTIATQAMVYREGDAAWRLLGLPSCCGPGSRPHPRLWLGEPATAARVVAQAQANTPEWVALKSFCDTKTLPNFDYQAEQTYRFIANFSLCYRIVRAISGDGAAAIYAQKAVNVLTNATYPVLSFTDYGTDSGYGIRNYVPAMAIALDWLHDASQLTPSLKSQVITRIKAWLDYYEASGYSNDEIVANYNAGYLYGRMVAAVALYGEDAASPTIWRKAHTHLSSGLRKLDQLNPGGHWAEGWNYGPAVFATYLLSASLMKGFSGEPEFLQSLWLKNNPLMRLHGLSPDGLFFYDDGLWSGDEHGLPTINDMIAAGHAFGWGNREGAIARAYVNRVSLGGITPSNTAEEWKSPLFYSNASVPVNAALLPMSYHARGSGLVMMRESWGNSGTWGSMIAGPYSSYQEEQDKDQGHLTIYRGTPLLLDTGHGYFGTNYLRNTVFHNTYTLEGRVDTSYAGQLEFTLGCPNSTGSNPIGINAYVEAGTYAFSSGEFSAAYQGVPSSGTCGRNAITWLNRSMLFVRPGLFVVYDQVNKTADQGPMVPTMHLHFPVNPTEQPGSSLRQVSFDSGGARLQVASVLPANATATLTSETANQSAGPGVSNFHYRVRHPATPTPQYQSFLTVFRAGNSVGGYSFPVLVPIAGTNASGVHVGGLLASESAGPIVAVFADTGTPGAIPASLQYTYGGAAGTRHHVAKLKPNTLYTVGITGSGTLTVSIAEHPSLGTRTDAAGVLTFTP